MFIYSCMYVLIYWLITHAHTHKSTRPAVKFPAGIHSTAYPAILNPQESRLLSYFSTSAWADFALLYSLLSTLYSFQALFCSILSSLLSPLDFRPLSGWADFILLYFPSLSFPLPGPTLLCATLHSPLDVRFLSYFSTSRMHRLGLQISSLRDMVTGLKTSGRSFMLDTYWYLWKVPFCMHKN